MNENVRVKPHVLLLGNGINRSFGGTSWNSLIDKINIRKGNNSNWPNNDNMLKNMPMPLQAILVTNNNIKDAMKNNRSIFEGRISNEEQRHVLQRVLSMGFDDILTTNYSYEIECAALGKDSISDYKLKKASKCTRGKVEQRYLIHSYNEVCFQETQNRIWHIHGECRKPNSMILGHYWYSNQLVRMKNEVDGKRDSYFQRQKLQKSQIFDSWIDSFILGDVYVLGFGFDFSEIDLWWILNRKMREKAEKGKVYFYEMASEADYAKVELLRLFGAIPIDFGMKSPKGNDSDCAECYKSFYTKALADIERKIREAK